MELILYIVNCDALKCIEHCYQYCIFTYIPMNKLLHFDYIKINAFIENVRMEFNAIKSMGKYNASTVIKPRRNHSGETKNYSL